MRQEKWIRFRLLIVSAFIFPYICWTDEENKSESDVILPRCDKFQEMDESYFDRLEFIERHLRDSIQRIHDFDRLQQKLNMSDSKQSKTKSAQYFDYRAYLKRQEKMLKEIDFLLLEKRKEANRFADPAALEKGTGGNTNNTNGFNEVEREKK